MIESTIFGQDIITCWGTKILIAHRSKNGKWKLALVCTVSIEILLWILHILNLNWLVSWKFAKICRVLLLGIFFWNFPKSCHLIKIFPHCKYFNLFGGNIQVYQSANNDQKSRLFFTLSFSRNSSFSIILQKFLNELLHKNSWNFKKSF